MEGSKGEGRSRAVSGKSDQPAAAESAASAKAGMRTRPTRTFPEYFHTLKVRHRFTPSICIDAGAGFGTAALYRAFPDAFHVVAEPLPELLAKLEVAMRPYRHRIVRGALHSEAGRRHILRFDNPLRSTLVHARAGSDKAVVEAECFTLDSVMSGVADHGPILLKTDCQGTDLEVIKGGLKTLERCEVVIMEVSMFRFWAHPTPEVGDVVLFMKSRGFVVHDILDGWFRPYDRALAQIDVAFVKEDGFLRASRRWA